MFVVYTSPVKFTTDENHARIIAEDHYEKTREIVAIEEIDTTKEFYTTSLSYQENTMSVLHHAEILENIFDEVMADFKNRNLHLIFPQEVLEDTASVITQRRFEDLCQ